MNINHLLNEYSDFFENRINIQKKIMKINEKNIDNFKDFLLRSNLFNQKSSCRFLLDTISCAFYARPKIFDLLINIIENFKVDIQKYFTSDELFFEFFTLNITRLRLYQIGLIDLKTFSKIREIDDETIFFFSPEIKELIEKQPEIIHGTYFEKNKNRINKYNDNIQSKKFSRPNTMHFCDDQIAKIIENDSISEFQRIISQTNLSIDSKIKLNQEVYYILPTTSPTLIEYAMFFNSIEIFKFLLLNNARMDNLNSPCFAIAGGSYDIIHILEQQNIISPQNAHHLNSFIISAIRYHRNEIADYLIDSLGFCFDFESLAASIRYNNYDAFVKSVPVLRVNPNQRGSEFETAMYTCVNFGRLEFLKFLSHIDGIDFNVKSISVEWSPLHLAASYNQLEVIKYLCSMTSEEEIKKQKISSNLDENENTNENDNNNENENDNNNEDVNDNNNENENNNENDNNNENENKNVNDNNNENENNREKNQKENELNDNKNNDDDDNENERIDSKETSFQQMDMSTFIEHRDEVPHNEQNSQKESSRFIDVNVRSVNGITPLHLATSNGFARAVSFLCSIKSVNVNARNLRGETPLHFATLGNVETLIALCQRPDIDLNAVNEDGETPLFFAIKSENVEMVRYLLSFPKLNRKIQSRNGQTPASLAQKRFTLYHNEKCWDIMKLFNDNF